MNEMTLDDIARRSQAWINLGIRLLVMAAFLFIALKVVQTGYLPPGDVRRHAAQAISGKDYREVLVLRPEYKIDHSPGWDLLLRQLHLKLGLTEDNLVAFSITVGLLCIFYAPMPWLRCPEAWVAALLVFTVGMPGFMLRLAQARPFLLTEGILIALLLSWSKPEKPAAAKLILSTLAFAASTWIHGTWYLWAVVPFAVLLSGQVRNAIVLGFCWIIGCLLGASFTGHPFEFLQQAVVLAGVIAHEHVPQSLLVGEFQPSTGEITALLVLALVFVWRRRTSADLFRAPVFWLMVVCWLLSLKAARFWVDWGMPSALVWLALEFQGAITDWLAANPLHRLVVAGLLTMALYFNATADIGGRYSDSLREVSIDASKPELKGWMPEPGGIFYAADMNFFYKTFYKNPTGDWRYISGFEPAWMPPDDLVIYRNIEWNRYAWESYEPWVKKLRPQDRLAVFSRTQPDLPPLEWIDVGDTTWIGRLPKNKRKP